MHPSLTVLAFATLSLVVTPSVSAQSVTLTPDQVLRVHFAVPSPPSPTPDVLSLGLGLTNVGAAHSSRTARLYNCDQLLGTATETSFGGTTGALALGVANGWRQVGSPYTFGNPADVADFSSLQNSTIQGLVEFEIATGAITFDLANVTLRLIRATGASGGSVSSPQPVITEALLGPRLIGPSPGSVGVVNTWTVQGAAPGSLILHGFGFLCSPFLVPCAPPVLYDIVPQSLVIGFADAGGRAVVQINVPAIAAGVTLLMQTVEFLGPDCRVSNLVKHTF